MNWRHISGDADGRCVACEESEAFFDPDDQTPPHVAEPVDDGAGEGPWCWCGHGIEYAA